MNALLYATSTTKPQKTPGQPVQWHTKNHNKDQFYLSRRSAGPSPNNVIGSPSARRPAFTSASSVETVICLALRRRSNAARASCCLSLTRSSNSRVSPVETSWKNSLTCLYNIHISLIVDNTEITWRNVDMSSFNANFYCIASSWTTRRLRTQPLSLFFLQASVENTTPFNDRNKILIVWHFYSVFFPLLANKTQTHKDKTYHWKANKIANV